VFGAVASGLLGKRINVVRPGLFRRSGQGPGRRRGLGTLSQALARRDWVLIGYALMSSHVHLPLVAGADPLAGSPVVARTAPESSIERRFPWGLKGERVEAHAREVRAALAEGHAHEHLVATDREWQAMGAPRPSSRRALAPSFRRTTCTPRSRPSSLQVSRAANPQPTRNGWAAPNVWESSSRDPRARRPRVDMSLPPRQAAPKLMRAAQLERAFAPGPVTT